MKRVISICLALWLSVFCCYALETHSELAELPESTESIVETVPTIAKEQSQTVDYSKALADITLKISELISIVYFLVFVLLPIVVALCLLLLIVSIIKSFIDI